ncbi:phosphate ABC transporter permease subunit PstC [Aureimonas phyllosphaerae]|uniref:Phosphate transport system permease protein n=1 Tax=Aureimonas phyllosphaerae TaxID=1166078 RepID=A0A7W6BUG9_9HYPH|nr:phosphate ABC transporter permease subunit PstC [Aureimonas phyllosphaerae]MBB3933956.1 phosphate transport system permease protein [Aureimonas phyllosphaerae]MBB3958828.1 phosphate transport system permease protein [Aureimonas phyllosphaerae]SFF19931.1 phosphate ABC transporter membrane protein 1, PhoT family [Aureimonas phyllosphaerae]
MSILAIVLTVLALGAVGFVAARRRSAAVAAASTDKLHSRSIYHGVYAAMATTIPALLLMAIWLAVSPVVVTSLVVVPDATATETNLAPTLRASLVRSIGEGIRLLPPEERENLDQINVADLRPLLARRGIPVPTEATDSMIRQALERNRLEDTSRLAMTVLVLAVAVAGLVFALRRVAVRLRARNQVERVVKSFLVLCSSIAILTTVGIVCSMLFESIDFFSRVPPSSFFFGTVWEPRFAAAGSTATGQFGLIPLLLGTLYIAFVAMLFAVPVGLFAAIYMAEYASNRVRSVVKPLLEVLAGIPTIVYGFFALITVGPFLRDLSADINGLLTGDYSSFIQAQSILTAGLVMGIMLIPFVSSLSDDIITAVPRSLRDGSLGLGATPSETVKKVVLPAALPGIVSALLLTASRAIGETMIVVLAAGIAANITANPFEAMTTVTIKIVSQLTGDLDFTSPQSLVAFALGITLFAITLVLNVIALAIVRKYREQYD